MSASARIHLSETEDRKEAASFRRQFFVSMTLLSLACLAIAVGGVILGIKLGLIK